MEMSPDVNKPHLFRPTQSWFILVQTLHVYCMFWPVLRHVSTKTLQRKIQN